MGSPAGAGRRSRQPVEASTTTDRARPDLRRAQTLLEPVPFGTACARGTRARFDTEYLSLAQEADGVTAIIRHRRSDTTYTIRAKPLIGVDEDVALPFEGRMGDAGSMNIVSEADLSRYAAHRPSVLHRGAIDDPYGDWAAAREVPEAGAILVRPDMYVPWRATETTAATEPLGDAVARMLGKLRRDPVRRAA